MKSKCIAPLIGLTLLVLNAAWAAGRPGNMALDDALSSAIQAGNVESVNVLLDAGASPDATNQLLHEPAICFAIQMSVAHVEDIVRALISRKAKLSVLCGSDTLLALAVQGHLTGVIKLLTAAGANGNEIGGLGQTAKDLAAQSHDVQLMQAIGAETKTISCKVAEPQREMPDIISFESPIVPEVSSLDIDQSADMMLIGGNDGTVTLWILSSGRKTLTVAAHRTSVDVLEFSKDHSRFFSSSTQDGSAKIFGVPDAGERLEIAGLHPEPFIKTPALISADWKTVVGVADARTLIAWNTDACTELDRVTLPSDISGLTAVGAGSSLFAILTTDKTGYLWRVGSQSVQPLRDDTRRITYLASSKTKNVIALGTTSPDGADKPTNELELWQVDQSPRLSHTLLWNAPKTEIIGPIAFSKSGQSLFVASGSFMRIIDADNLMVKVESDLGFLGVPVIPLAQDGCFASDSGDQIQFIGRTANDEKCPSFSLQAYILGAAQPLFTKDLNSIVVRNGNGLLRWSFEDGKPKDIAPNLGQAEISAVGSSTAVSTIVVGDTAGNLTEIGGKASSTPRSRHVTDCSVTALGMNSDSVFAALGKDWTGRCNGDNLLAAYRIDDLSSVGAPLQLSERGASKITVGTLVYTISDFNSGVTAWDFAARSQAVLPQTVQSLALDASSVAELPENRLAFGLNSLLNPRSSGAAVASLDGNSPPSIFASPREGAVSDLLYDRKRGQMLGGGERGEVYAWNVETGSLRSVLLDSSQISRLALDADGHRLATGLSDGTVTLWDLNSQKAVARIIAFADVDNAYWLVTTPDGRYDSNSPGDLPGASWVLPASPISPMPIESFIREYYEPSLLSKVIKGEPLPPIAKLESLDRDPPLVKIIDVRPDAEDPLQVTVIVDVSGPNSADTRAPQARGKPRQVQDLRVFRDGQLIHAQNVSGPLHVDDKTSRYEFTGVKLPTNPNRWEKRRPKDLAGRKAQFSAYAFNEDLVKSLTSKFDYYSASELPQRQRRAFVISIGMNEYENSAWNLTYAADDACATLKVLESALRRSGQFDSVVPVPLISGKCATPNSAKSTTVDRELVRDVFELLSGHHVREDEARRIPRHDQLDAVTPDDFVLISYSGHGFAKSTGEFFLFPFDIGPGSARTELDTARLISSSDLSLWLRDVDAGAMTLIIDACQSAASIQGAGFRPGPMGSRGLGELAYNKGMRILAASQAESVALESAKLRHGILTYALLVEGLSEKSELRKLNGQDITESDWLTYGVDQVPKLYEKLKTNTFAGRRGFHMTDVKAADRSADVQTPVLFDFRASGLAEPLLAVDENERP